MEFERIAAGAEQDWRRLLGRKVSVRYRVDGEGGAPVPAEAIGVVMSVSGESAGSVVEIVTKRGDVRVVPVDDVVTGKVWPV